MYENLLSEMKKLKITNSDIAQNLNMSEKEFERKIKGDKPFNLNEAIAIRDFLTSKIYKIDYLFK